MSGVPNSANPGHPDWIGLAEAEPRLWQAYQPFGPRVRDRGASLMIETAILSGQVPVRGERRDSLNAERIDSLLGPRSRAQAHILLGTITIPGNFDERLLAQSFRSVEVEWNALWAYIVHSLLPKGALLTAMPEQAASDLDQIPEARTQRARKAGTQDRNADLQRSADELWQQHPTWTKQQIAEELRHAEMASDRRNLTAGKPLSLERIIRIINKP